MSASILLDLTPKVTAACELTLTHSPSNIQFTKFARTVQAKQEEHTVWVSLPFYSLEMTFRNSHLTEFIWIFEYLGFKFSGSEKWKAQISTD